ncbi:hypothetical protein GF354_00565 [Candidatus Peregrinibacteria bacterium]|nr:hypothetical protein [Candidatus Peregrinibacteria bacterium]
MEKIKHIISIIFLVFVSTSIIAYNYYSLIANDTNHTGLDLLKVKALYLIFSLIAFGMVFMGKSNKKAKIVFTISAILGLAFIANIWLFEKTEIMLYYSDWLECCM